MRTPVIVGHSGLDPVGYQDSGEQPTQIVRLVRLDGGDVYVRGLDCLDGTPLIDLKPDRCAFTPLAPLQPGDDQVGNP